MQNKISAMVLCCNNPSYSKYSIPILSDYFQRHGIDFKIIRDEDIPAECQGLPASWYGLLAHRLVPGYDCVIRWGLDLLPTKSTPSIVDFIDCNFINAVVENASPETSPFPHHRFNGDLIAYPKWSQDVSERIFNAYRSDPKSWPSYEQYYQSMAWGDELLDIKELDKRFNQFWNPGVSVYGDAWCHHYTCNVPREKKEFWIQKHYELYASN